MKKSRQLSVLFYLAIVIIPSVHAVGVPGQGTWETTLQPRDLDGNPTTAEAYYDTDLNITWLADSYHLASSVYWYTAYTWITNFNPYDSGITGWRLPMVTDTGTAGCNASNSGTDCGYNVDTTTSEMAHMFYVTLGNTAAYSTSGDFQPDYGLSNTGPFIRLDPSPYWSFTSYAPDLDKAWNFHFDSGFQYIGFKATDFNYAWAVHDGDVGTPILSSDDTDNDGLLDYEDNCILIANGTLIPDAGGNSQLDTDWDGYGNICDPDLNGNGVVDNTDLSILKAALRTNAPDQDLNGNGVVDSTDYSIAKGYLRKPPGPSCCGLR